MPNKQLEKNIANFMLKSYKNDMKYIHSSFYTSHSHVNTGPPTIVRSDSHGIIMNQHHPQEDSKDSLIQHQVHQQEMLDQHQQQDMQQDDDVDNVSQLTSFHPMISLSHKCIQAIFYNSIFIQIYIVI